MTVTAIWKNTADSIFCAHGAGYAVKWDEVEQHMHLPSCLTAQPEEVDVPETPVRSAGAAYHGSLAEDKELMAIFERTYGKIERSPRQALYTPKEEPAQYHGKPDPAYDGEEYLHVDGTTSSSPGRAENHCPGQPGRGERTADAHSQQLLRLSAVPADPGI